MSNALLKYLNLLHTSSKEFNLRMAKIRNKYIEDGEPVAEVFDKKHVKDIEKILRYFLIPVNEDYVDIVATYMFYNEPYEKSCVRYFDDERSLGNKKWIRTPSIIIELIDYITEDEWRDIWHERIKEGHTERMDEDEKDITFLDSGIRVPRKWEKFDDKLFLYKLSKGGKKLKEAHKKLNETKVENGEVVLNISFGAARDVDSLRDMVKDIAEYVGDL